MTPIDIDAFLASLKEKPIPTAAQRPAPERKQRKGNKTDGPAPDGPPVEPQTDADTQTPTP